MTRPPFAFLHGGGQGSWIWDEAIAALRSAGCDAPIVALDVPGCGTKRGRDVSAIDADAVAAELIAELRALGSRVMLVGHSLAGPMIVRMAAIAPDLFARLVYLTCSSPLPGQNVLQMIGTGVHGAHPDEVGWPLDPAITPGREQARAMLCNDMDAAQAEALLARLGQDHWPMDVLTRTDSRYDHLAAIPATYILCEQDQILPPEWQERFAERLHTDETLRMDAGHQAMNTRPAELAALLIDLAGRT